MRRERVSFALCSVAVLMASVISYACAMCLADAFSLFVQPAYLVTACCVVSGLAVLILSVPHSWVYGCSALAVYLLLLIWQHQAVMLGLSDLLYHVTYEYSKCFQIGLLGQPTGMAQYVLLAMVMPMAWLSAWVICREGYSAFVALACAPVFVLCLLVVDLAPIFWLVVLTGALLLLILSGSVRTSNANEGGKLLWWLSVPVVIVIVTMMMLSPSAEYVRSDWSQDLQGIAEDTFKPEFWKTRLSGGWNSKLKTIDLSKIGPQKKTGAFALEYTSQYPISYLRGVSYGRYEENSWKNIDNYDAWQIGGEPMVTTLGNGSGVLQVRTPSARSMLYTAYHLSSMPAIGLAVDDAYIKNTDELTEYQVFFEQGDVIAAGQSGEYEQLVRIEYLQLPEELREELLQILGEAGLEHASAEEICAYVQQSGQYDLAAPAVPDGEDFALYFLRQSHRGYCVHFATSAALLLRAANIPARYVTGYSVDGIAGQWNKVTEDEAHAWVEYYVSGVGWFPLDPTPVMWREFEQQEEREEDTQLPQEEQPEQLQEPEKTERPDKPVQTVRDEEENERTENSAWLVLLIVPIMVVLVIVRRWVILYCRAVRLKKLAPNRAALELWQRLVKLHKALGTSVSEQWICLAEKAKFSQHTVSQEELKELNAQVQKQKDSMASLPLPRRLWYRFGLVLY